MLRRGSRGAGDAKIRVHVPFVASDKRMSSSRISMILPVLTVGKEADEQFEEYVDAIEEMGTTANEVMNVFSQHLRRGTLGRGRWRAPLGVGASCSCDELSLTVSSTVQQHGSLHY